MNQIQTTVDSYNRTAKQYAEKTACLLRKGLVQKFEDIVPYGRILDAGCGNGRDAAVFTNKGYDVIGIDLAPEMLKIAQQTAPKATFKQMDLRKMTFSTQSFNGIWALASFLHVPKSEVPSALRESYRVLIPGGGIHIGIKAGIGEEFSADTRYGKEIMKFYSYFKPGEMEASLEQEGFRILDTTTIERDTKEYLHHPEINIFARKEN